MTHYFDPYTHAAELGFAVEVELDDYLADRPNIDGYFDLEGNAIHLRPGMRQIQEACVLAHELGHAVNGHSGNSHRNEVIADRWAAEMMIDRDQLIDLMIARPDNYAAWSLELGVTTKILWMYLNAHALDLGRRRPRPYRVAPMSAQLRSVG